MIFFRPVFLLLIVASSAMLTSAEDQSASTFVFRDVKYFHRWSGENQHEFTPAKQEDLEHWTDMITINAYPDVDDGENLASTANAVLGNYQSHGGKILRTNSVPASDERPAEHFVAVVFNQPGFTESAFARLKLVDGKGYSFVYSHRSYGNKAREEINGWLAAKGAEVEESLMKWDAPSLASLR